MTAPLSDGNPVGYIIILFKVKVFYKVERHQHTTPYYTAQIVR